MTKFILILGLWCGFTQGAYAGISIDMAGACMNVDGLPITDPVLKATCCTNGVMTGTAEICYQGIAYFQKQVDDGFFANNELLTGLENLVKELTGASSDFTEPSPTPTPPVP